MAHWAAPLAAAAIAALCGCSDGSAGAAQASPSPASSPVAVTAVNATYGTLRPVMTLPGTIAPAQTIALSNSINEPAAGVFVEEGAHVRRGQLLAQLAVDDLQASLNAARQTAQADRSRVAQAGFNATLSFAVGPQQVRASQAALDQAQSTLQEAVLNLRREHELVSQGYLPQQNYDEQAVVVRNDQQAVASAQSQLAQAAANLRANGSPTGGLQAATIEAARRDEFAQLATADQLARQIARASIVSPVDGVIINRNINPGEYPAGRQIFTIEANATVYAILTASAVQAYQIGTGAPVALTRAGIPNGRFAGRVVAVLDAATPGSTNFTVKAAFANADGALRAGTPVQATIALTPRRGVIVPASAFTDDTHTQLMAVIGGHARAQHVVEQETDGANSVVSGLTQGEQIVRNGGASVESGQAVELVR